MPFGTNTFAPPDTFAPPEVFGNDQNNFFDASKFTLGGVKLHGGRGNDTLIGTSFNDTLDGGIGNDTIRQTSANNQKVFNDSISGAGSGNTINEAFSFNFDLLLT